MSKHCNKCKGLLVQGTDTCIICGKSVATADLTVSAPNPIRVPSFRPPIAKDIHMRLVTPPFRRPATNNVEQADSPAPASRVIPIPPPKPSTDVPGPYIRFVTAPGGRRIEDTSTAKSYKTK